MLPGLAVRASGEGGDGPEAHGPRTGMRHGISEAAE